MCRQVNTGHLTTMSRVLPVPGVPGVPSVLRVMSVPSVPSVLSVLQVLSVLSVLRVLRVLPESGDVNGSTPARRRACSVEAAPTLLSATQAPRASDLAPGWPPLLRVVHLGGQDTHRRQLCSTPAPWGAVPGDAGGIVLSRDTAVGGPAQGIPRALSLEAPRARRGAPEVRETWGQKT